ncbi:hypothetical protein L6164_032358 [Bauhinia variegata]|uniref:Uncharacterized protein n=1 Tax=Bauhinia variegata TaxID=167791 RepID=A0ACB9KNL0_BAUVA|nr:hypothetical protein L6164_032358 [Bauhinia variegata]
MSLTALCFALPRLPKSESSSASLLTLGFLLNRHKASLFSSQIPSTETLIGSLERQFCGMNCPWNTEIDSRACSFDAINTL